MIPELNGRWNLFTKSNSNFAARSTTQGIIIYMIKASKKIEIAAVIIVPLVLGLYFL
jgi:hypothetical protein